MKKDALKFRFISRLERLPSATGTTHIAPVPEEVAQAWKRAKVRRLVGTVNGHPVNRALQNHAEGGSFIMVGRPLLKDIDAGPKSTLVWELGPDPRPDELDLPEELATALEQDPEANARWETFTVGRRRSLLHYVTGARLEATRIKRAVELTDKVRTHTLAGDLNPQRAKPKSAKPEILNPKRPNPKNGAPKVLK